MYAIVHPVTRIASEFNKDIKGLPEVMATKNKINAAVQTAIALKLGTTETDRASETGGTVGLAPPLVQTAA
jgi:hypothetical protein